MPKIASASIGRVVEGILSVVNESGYQMLLAVTQNSPKKEMEYFQNLGKIKTYTLSGKSLELNGDGVTLKYEEAKN